MWWISAALAAPPGAVVHTEAIGVGDIVHLEASTSRSVMAFHTGSNLAHLYDTNTWVAESGDADCTLGGVALAGDDTLYAVCVSGEVKGWTWDGESLTALTNKDGGAILATVDDANAEHLAWSAVSEQLIVLETVQGEFNNEVVALHTVDPATGDVDTTGTFPVSLGFSGYQTSVAYDDRLFVSHGQADISILSMGTGAITASTLQFGGLSVVDLAPTDRSSVLSVGTQGVVAELSTATLQWIPWMYTLETGSSAVALAFDEEDPWLLHAYDDTIDVWDAPGGSTPSDTAPLTSITAPTAVSRLVIGQDGYAFAGSEAGEIMVLTSNPWISEADVSPSLIADGQTSTLSFTVDTDGSYSVALGGDRTGGGEELASGEASAGETVTVEITADDRFSEGSNPIWVLHDAGLLRVGHARVLLSVDNPPPAVAWQASGVRPANQSLVLGFVGVTDEDLSHYNIYISTTPFEPSDFAEGGPAYEGPDSITSPIEVVAEPGADVSQRISGLTNGTTYTVAIRAVDAGGLEGPMSDILEGTPVEGLNASGLSGETGGPLCATSGGAFGGFGLLALVAGLARRRRGAALAALAVAGLGLSNTSMAAAPDDAEEEEASEPLLPLFDDDHIVRKIYELFGADQSRRLGTFEIRYGNLTFEDRNSAVPSVYDETNNDGLYIEFGPQIFQVLEFKAGLGFYQDTAWTIDPDSGNRTADRTMLTWAPLSLSATLRLHFFDEQPIVPYVTRGVDHLIWREKADDGEGGKTTVQGAFQGKHRAYGVNVLLDVFAPRRAGLLEAQTGINDTWIVLEWRDRQTWERVVDPSEDPNLPVPGEGISFVGEVFTAGLKLDF